MRARSALFTLFGDVVRPAGGEAWLSTLTKAMTLLGFQAPAVRTALHRMVGEGWVEPRREGRYAAYRLTDRGVARLEEAAERIYRLRSRAWDGRWHVLVARDRGRVEAAAKELEWVGFGRLADGVWVSPHDHRAAVEALDLGDAVIELADAGTRDDQTVAGQAWDLAGLRTQHQTFLRTWTDVETPTEPAAAFALRVNLVHQWRKFLFLDPGLPLEVLPDNWPGTAAAERFRSVYEAVLEPSWTWYHAAQADHEGISPRPLDGLADGPNPFAAGLAALGDHRGSR